MGQSIVSLIKPEELRVLQLLAAGRSLTVDELTEYLDCDEDEVRDRMAHLAMLTGVQFTVPANWGHA